MELVGAEVTVSGIVQGIGYRYFVYRRARSLAVFGWVRNNRDGSVTVAAEGEKDKVEGLIEVLREGPPGAAVRDMAVNWREYRGKFKAFDIIN